MMTTTPNGVHAPALSNGVGNANGSQAAEALPASVLPRRVILRDRITTATLIPFPRGRNVPLSLLNYLCIQLNREIAKGNTYAFRDEMQLHQFSQYWFANVVGIMLVGDWGSTVEECLHALDRANNVDKDWDRECLGSFFIKPNYPGRSSHICNGTFLVTDGARNRGVGRLMGEGYLEWAPKLGFTYSVFDLVYETNVASCRIWDALGFKRVGRIKGCGHLNDHEEPVDAIIYGRELSTSNPDDGMAEERFDRIKFYLKHQKYPDGIGRAEKSRLRSASTHYRLLIDETGHEEDKLFLRDKEVIADIQKQYEITRDIHRRAHEGINKTTARINEKYHWLRIKETATLVIKNCPECNEPGKRVAPNLGQPAIVPEMPIMPSTDSQMEVAYDLPAHTTPLQAINTITADLAVQPPSTLATITTDSTSTQIPSALSSMSHTPSILDSMPLSTPISLTSQSPSGLEPPHASFNAIKQASPMQLPPQQAAHQLLNASVQQSQFPTQQQLPQFTQTPPQQHNQQPAPQAEQQQMAPPATSMQVPSLSFPQAMTYDMSMVPVDPQIMAQMAQLQGYAPFMQSTMQQMPQSQQQPPSIQQTPPQPSQPPPQQQRQQVMSDQHQQLTDGDMLIGAGGNVSGMGNVQQQVPVLNANGEVAINPTAYAVTS